MISDTERREVARKIRHAWVNVPDRDPVRHHLRVLREIYEAVGINDGEADAIGLFDRLADLIEPGEPKVRCVAEVKVDGERLEELVHDAAAELTGIDRDALLALAEEMEEFGNLPVKHPGIRVLHNDDFSRELGYARRIRDALGVTR